MAAFTVILTFLSILSQPEKELRVTEDLQNRWKILSEGKFVDYQGNSVKTIYLTIDIDKSAGNYLKIQSPKGFYLFINSSLVSKSNSLMLQADSLRKKLGESAVVSIYQPGGISQLTTKWVLYQEIGTYTNPIRPNRSFYDFVVIAVILLIIFFTALLRSNPQLTTDYLNFAKLLSFKRRDDNQFVLRITSSVNLLFYSFCSLLTALALITAVHFSEGMSLKFATSYTNVISYFGLWLIASIVITAVLMSKLLLASGISMLFGWRDTAGFQFFNFIRGLVLSLLMIGIVSIIGFSLRIDVDYYFLVKSFWVMLTVNAVLIFFKLLNRESASGFHLFSYLCATEILPLVILTKVFLF